MSKNNRISGLLLAIVLVCGVTFQPEMREAFAEIMEQAGHTTTSMTKQVEQAEVPLAGPTEDTASAQGAAEDSATMQDPTTGSEAEASATPEASNGSPDACSECGEVGGHAEGCSQYAAQSASYPWSDLTDEEFAMWFMDEANADTVKGILTSEGEDYDALMERIDTILSGEDEALAQQVQEYLTVLTGMDEPETQAADEYIYFDLALGDVEIGVVDSETGKTVYGGWVYVDSGSGKHKEWVGGEHKEGNKYYIYQSTETNRETTGYARYEEDFKQHQNCRVPTYNRVYNGTTPWTDYVTNNINVKEVSTNWDIAAVNSDRTPTENKITFASASNYTADVTIDNIWTTYRDKRAADWRSTGGIGANLSTGDTRYENTHISIRMKGDNRVGCVHYSAYNGKGNTIEFYDGETTGTSGSITVADFKDEWGANHWSSAIGGADSPAGESDKSDGIVIRGGVIYAGTTPEDNCTAIGGGGNDYGGVTIKGGTVTAVVSSTGTAIGGGIGYGSAGGDTDVLISGGTVYAYNLGIKKNGDTGVGNVDDFADFVPAAAIGGGGSKKSAGGLTANITIEGGEIYAQSMGGPAIGGGGSAEAAGGPATITIKGGSITAKSIPGYFGTTQISEGVSIGGGTGLTSGGSVKLDITGGTIRTASIGGGTGTKDKTIGAAEVTIGDTADITGQVIMAATGVEGETCSFTMTGGKLHGSDVTKTVDDFYYLEDNGGAVWMQDPNGTANISGGTISGCTAYRGGAVYMEGGTFTLSGDEAIQGIIQGNKAVVESATNAGTTGRGGGVYVTGGTANIQDGTLKQNAAQARGGGLYVTGEGDKTGTVSVAGGSIQGNTAGFITDTVPHLPNDAGRGGGVYLEGGQFTMSGGEVSGNTANYRGGGIFLTSSPALNGGTISGNTAKDSGGGICVNGASVTLGSPDMRIYGNTATKNGGGVAVLNGSFTLSGGAVGVEKGTPNTATNGGGVYVKAENAAVTAVPAADSGETATEGDETETAANVTVTSGNIWYNKADNGGGVYLANGEGDFTLDGAGAVISYNTAKNGGGVYLYKNPLLNRGTIEHNIAEPDTAETTEDEASDTTGNGGGMYINDCLVTLNPTGAVFITDNDAKNGAGIYIHGDPNNTGGTETGGTGSTKTPGTPEASGTPDPDTISGATPVHRVGLLVGPEKEDGQDFDGTLTLTGNTATKSGGAVCVSAGRFQLGSDKATFTGNKAVNGGGVAVLHGNFTMTEGSIGGEGGANHADNGGGAYVSEGEIWFKGGSLQYNTATDGGGAYVTGGKFNMLGGVLADNVATGNGGGAYAAGEFNMLDGTIGGAGAGNTAKNGGGAYVANGNITVVNGEISHNSASASGGGFSVAATEGSVAVEMLSGKLTNNVATNNGGGMAVETANAQTANVEIGCLLDHKVKENDGKPSYPIEYEGAVYGKYASYLSAKNEHEDCPEVRGNQAGNIGGGFYMNSSASTLSFFCVEEAGNTAAKGKENSTGMDVEGGRVVIGDEKYHNHEYAAGHGGQEAPWGYISMDNATLVNGGQVDIYGDMSNPIFMDEVTVDIHKGTDHFKDHRRVYDGTKSYKVHYIENFMENGIATGLYQAFQYDEGNTKIAIVGSLYNRPGYMILGWCTQQERHDGAPGNYYYKVGTEIELSDPDEAQGMGEHSIDCPNCGVGVKDANLLELYAIWDPVKFTVKFDPNVLEGETYTGSMANQQFVYGTASALTKNEYERPGYFFEGWNTKPDGSGTDYADEADGSKISTENGSVVTLYAKWQKCDHTVPSRWSYKELPDGKTIQRDCSCGGQTLTATLTAESTVYDGNSHPATLTLSDATAWGEDAPVVAYTASWLSDDGIHHDAGTAPELSSERTPFHAGTYTATIKKPVKVTGSSGTAEEAGTTEGSGTEGAGVTESSGTEGTETEGTEGSGGSGETGATGEATVSVTYTIDKAEQAPPEKPICALSKNGETVSINKLVQDTYEFEDSARRKHTAKAEYRLTYQDEPNPEWHKFPDNDPSQTQLNLTMNTAYASYVVQARYVELTDYKASDITKADSVYFFTGDVKVVVVCDDGIDCKEIKPNGNNDITVNGIVLTLQTDEDHYYLVNGKYSVDAELQLNSGSTPTKNPTVKQDAQANNSFTVEHIETGSTLTITIGTTRKKPDPSAKVVPGQMFSLLADDATASTSISRDSAFTAAYQIKNFDPVRTVNNAEYGAYAGLELAFANGASNAKLPKDTTIIFRDRSNNGKTYWHYRVEAEAGEESVPLTAFQKMGGSEHYSVPTPTDEKGYVDLSYQFIVDFSQVADASDTSKITDGFSGDNLTMTLKATAKASSTNAPEVKPSVTVSMANSTFALEKTEGESSASSLTYNFTSTFTPSATASKWANRASALVLKLSEGSDALPPDTQIKAEVKGGDTFYLYRTLHDSEDAFIVPLPPLQGNVAQTEEVKLTLQSALFQNEAATYKFTVQWLISSSKAGKAPMIDPASGSAVTNQAGATQKVTFSTVEGTTPSLKVTRGQRVLTNTDTLNLDIESKNMDGYTVSAALLRKSNDGTYVGTGLYPWDPSKPQNGSALPKTLDAKLTGQTPGSFCLMLTVRKDDSITTVMEVPYYFVIKPAH